MGGDRVADLNRLTSGLTTRFIDPSTGDERARFTIAQEYYFTNPEVTLVDDEPETDLRGADVAVGASFKVGADFSAEQSMQYDEGTTVSTPPPWVLHGSLQTMKS